MAARLLILADDFTGALDTGVRLARAGVPTKVAVLRGGGRRLPGCGSPALVIDMESRHVGPAEAARRVRSLARSGIHQGVLFFYKKTDSTLRGNIGAELSALLSATGEDRLFFVPALPAAGRTTVNGVALVNGIPLHRTDFAADPLDPVTESEVSAIIGRQSGVAVESIPRGSELPDREDAAKRILVFDAETDADLEEIGRRMKPRGVPRAIAGCSGFASILPELLDLPRAPRAPVRLAPPMLAVCGSLNEVSRAQVRHAEHSGIPSHFLDPRFIGTGARRRTFGHDLALRIASSLTSTGAAILTTQASEAGCAACQESSGRSGRAVAGAVGGVVREVMSLARPSTLVLFGGDTAFGVVDALGIGGFQPVREISQGVVVSSARQGGRDLFLVTKAGGFGEADVLVRIREMLSREL